jgi:hypothetical protein
MEVGRVFGSRQRQTKRTADLRSESLRLANRRTAQTFHSPLRGRNWRNNSGSIGSHRDHDGNDPPPPTDGSPTNHRWVFRVTSADDALRAIAQIAIQEAENEAGNGSELFQQIVLTRFPVRFPVSLPFASRPSLCPQPSALQAAGL